MTNLQNSLADNLLHFFFFLPIYAKRQRQNACVITHNEFNLLRALRLLSTISVWVATRETKSQPHHTSARLTSAAVRNRQRQPARRWYTAALISSQIRCVGTRTRRGSTAGAGRSLPGVGSPQTSPRENWQQPRYSVKERARSVEKTSDDV